MPMREMVKQSGLSLMHKIVRPATCGATLIETRARNVSRSHRAFQICTALCHLCQCDDEVEKGARLRRHLMSRRIVDIERKALVRPVREEIDQLAFANQRPGDEQQHLRNAEA